MIAVKRDACRVIVSCVFCRIDYASVCPTVEVAGGAAVRRCHGRSQIISGPVYVIDYNIACNRLGCEIEGLGIYMIELGILCIAPCRDIREKEIVGVNQRYFFNTARRNGNIDRIV